MRMSRLLSLARGALGLLAPLAMFGLAACGGGEDAVAVYPPPTAILLLRYNASGAPEVNFGGGDGIVVTEIHPQYDERAHAVALQADGKIIVAGGSVLVKGAGAVQRVITLLRYNADGTLDPSFGIGGIVRTAVGSDDADASAVAPQPDGKIVVAGTTFTPFVAVTGVVVARYNADGSLDANFGTQGIVTTAVGSGLATNNEVNALALQPLDGKIVVAGHVQPNVNGNRHILLLRYNPDGTPDTSFGDGGIVDTPLASDARINAIRLQPADQKILVAGSVGNFTAPPMDVALLRYNPDGSLDTGFGNAGIVTTDIGSSVNFANALALQNDGKIVVAGNAFVDALASGTSDIALLRYNANGTLDASFGAGGIVVTDVNGFDNAFSVALQSDGKIVVSGSVNSGPGLYGVELWRAAVLRYNPNGTLDSSFGSGGVVTTSAIGPSVVSSANAVAIEPGGGIVAAGYD